MVGMAVMVCMCRYNNFFTKNCSELLTVSPTVCLTDICTRQFSHRISSRHFVSVFLAEEPSSPLPCLPQHLLWSHRPHVLHIYTSILEPQLRPQSTLVKLTEYSRHTHDTLPVRLRYTHGIFTIHSRYAHGIILTVYSRYTHDTLPVHSRYTHGTLIHSQYTHGILTRHSRYTHGTLTVRSLSISMSFR